MPTVRDGNEHVELFDHGEAPRLENFQRKTEAEKLSVSRLRL
jgi:hypothetical protein